MANKCRGSLITLQCIRTPSGAPKQSINYFGKGKTMDLAHELHRQQLIKAYNNAVKRKDWQAARNYRDELNILIAKKIALS